MFVSSVIHYIVIIKVCIICHIYLAITMTCVTYFVITNIGIDLILFLKFVLHKSQIQFNLLQYVKNF